MAKTRTEVRAAKEAIFRQLLDKVAYGVETVHLNTIIKGIDISPYTAEAAAIKEFVEWLAGNAPDIQVAKTKFGTFLAPAGVELQAIGTINNRPSLTRTERQALIEQTIDFIADHCHKAGQPVLLDSLFELYNPQDYFGTLQTYKKVITDYLTEYSWKEYRLHHKSIQGVGTFVAAQNVPITADLLPSVTRPRQAASNPELIETLYSLCVDGATVSLASCYQYAQEYYSSKVYFVQAVKQQLEEDGRFELSAKVGKGTFFCAKGYAINEDEAIHPQPVIATITLTNGKESTSWEGVLSDLSLDGWERVQKIPAWIKKGGDFVALWSKTVEGEAVQYVGITGIGQKIHFEVKDTAE